MTSDARERPSLAPSRPAYPTVGQAVIRREDARPEERPDAWTLDARHGRAQNRIKMLTAYSNTEATYWVLVLTPFILGTVLVAIRNYRRHKKQRDAWLEGDITRHRE